MIDYVGIASALKEAMNDYTKRDKKNYGDTDIAKLLSLNLKRSYLFVETYFMVMIILTLYREAICRGQK